MGINSISELKGVITSGIQSINQYLGANPLVASATSGVIGAGIGASITAAAMRKTRRKTKKRKSKRRSGHSRKRRSKHYHHRRGKKTRRAGYHKKRGKIGFSHKQIHYTKNGQPYIILPSGKARFIKKSSSRRMKKRKGGYY
jgi:hypothetical protein